jgi:hypothetical protein
MLTNHFLDMNTILPNLYKLLNTVEARSGGFEHAPRPGFFAEHLIRPGNVKSPAGAEWSEVYP